MAALQAPLLESLREPGSSRLSPAALAELLDMQLPRTLYAGVDAAGLLPMVVGAASASSAAEQCIGLSHGYAAIRPGAAGTSIGLTLGNYSPT